MKLCKYSIDGSKCSKYFTCKDDHVDVKSLLQSELESQRNGNQWPLSSFGPFINKPSIPDYIEDQSFEEIRSMYYDSNMTFIQSAQKFLEAINNAENRMETLLTMNNDVINKLANIYDIPEKHFSTRNNAASQNSIFDSFSLKFPFGHTKSLFGPVPHQSKKWVLSGTLQEQDQPIFGRWPKTFKINCEIVEEEFTSPSGYRKNEYKLTFPTNNMHFTFGSSQTQQKNSNAFGFSQMEPNAMSTQQKHQQGTSMLFGCSQQDQEKKQQNTSNVFGCSQQQQAHGFANSQLMQKGTPLAFGVAQNEQKPQDSNIKFSCRQQELERKQQNTTNLFGSSQQQQIHGLVKSQPKQKGTPIAFDFPQKEQKPQDNNKKCIPVEEKIRQQQELEKVEAQKKQQQATGPMFGSTQVVQEPDKLNLQQNQQTSNGITFGLTQNQELKKVNMQQNKQKDTGFSFGSSLQIEKGIKQQNTAFAKGFPQKEGKPKDTTFSFEFSPQLLEKEKVDARTQQHDSEIIMDQESEEIETQQNQKGTEISFGFIQKEQESQMVGTQQKQQQDTGFAFGSPRQEPVKIDAVGNLTPGPTVTFGFSQKEQKQKQQESGLAFGGQQHNPEQLDGVLGSSKLQQNIFGTSMHNTNLFGTPNHQNSFSNINPGQRVGRLCVQPYGQSGMYGIGAAAPLGTQSSITGHQCDTCKQQLQDISAKLDGFLKVVKENQNIFEKQKNEINRISDLLQSWNNNIVGGPPSTNIENKRCVPPIIVKPKFNQNSEATKNYLKRKVDPLELSAQIDSVTNGADGSIIIKCKDEDSAEELQSELNDKCGQSYDISLEVLKNPQIIVTGIDEQIDDNQLIEIIQQQNNLDGEMELINRFQTTFNTNEYIAVIEVGKDFHEQLLKGKFPYLNIGWNKCFVESIESTTVLQCYNCWRFDHSINNCKNASKCPKCSENHSIGQCLSEQFRCTNCYERSQKLELHLDTRHDARNKNCPIYMSKMKPEARLGQNSNKNLFQIVAARY